MPLALIGASHFLIWAARNCARYSGVRRSGAITSPPICLRRCWTVDMSSVATVAWLSFWTIAFGVAAGRKSAYQLGIFEVGQPLLMCGRKVRQVRRPVLAQNRDGLHGLCCNLRQCKRE